ncbi:hypothetical protein [uncultured Shimia sp.]|uniref:hypothetical protein n=1 Tax=uncultured Shimia sp. TaxID=573152 RepID=UPI00260C34A1|nr:hypothetical protein [uncultured Shimia sp.]
MKVQFELMRTQPLFQSRQISELADALCEDDDGPDGGTFNRPTRLSKPAARPAEAQRAA